MESRSIDRGTFVKDQPVHAKLPSRFGEVSEVDWLADVAVDAELIGADNVALFVGGGEDDDGKCAGAVGLADPAQNFETVKFGELEIEEDDLGFQSIGPEENIDGFAAIAGNVNVIGDVRLLKGPYGEELVIRIILN